MNIRTDTQQYLYDYYKNNKWHKLQHQGRSDHEKTTPDMPDSQSSKKKKITNNYYSQLYIII